jgi:hypothetical protein
VSEGVEQVELTAPWQAVKDAGGTPELLAPETCLRLAHDRRYVHADLYGRVHDGSSRPP